MPRRGTTCAWQQQNAEDDSWVETHVAETTVALADVGNRPYVPLIHPAPEPDCVAGLSAGAPEGGTCQGTIADGRRYRRGLLADYVAAGIKKSLTAGVFWGEAAIASQPTGRLTR